MTDIFPAVVAVYPPSFVLNYEKPFLDVGVSDSGGKIFSESRVIVHKNRVIVGASTVVGAQTVFSDSVVEVFVVKPYTRVLTASGHLVVFTKSKGCGCGSRLRSWNPYGNAVRSSRD